MQNKSLAVKIVIFLVGVVLIFAIKSFFVARETVAIVNGERIFYRDLEKRLKNIYGNMVLERMIEEKIVMQLSKKYKLEVEKKELDKKYNELISQVGSKETFKKMLKESKMKEEDVREQLKLGILLEKLSQKDKLKEADLKKYYEKNKERFAEPEKIKVRHILVEKSDDTQKVIQALKDGMSFIDAAKKFSTDETSKDLGGDLGILERGAVKTMPRDIEKTLFSLAEGQYSQPIQTNLGWHIFYVDKKIPPKKKSFKEAKKDIEKFASTSNGWIEIVKLREKIEKKEI